jgi:hypothetical protein
MKHIPGDVFERLPKQQISLFCICIDDFAISQCTAVTINDRVYITQDEFGPAMDKAFELCRLRQLKQQ